ncbi:MAG: amino acid adenylation domain-containing protein [Edaphobacter sp.]|uniref:amino acid adenylation domain-containing protein n=1 Tax=Edaphobacter sp. TaxID=1934404 RepID=UPI00238CCF26|nr:amino acid adenylation domain-containing protein [Edaphobacter sp.]MDE1175198.1 amino acid adenylation domain-containing protein [Edaphobacter sp.]
MATSTRPSDDLTISEDPILVLRNDDISLLQRAQAGDSLLALFDRARQAYPDRIAATYESSCLTYQELNRSANQMAFELRARGVQRGDIVAIYLDRSITMIAAMLGVLKLGAAYLPIDPGYPKARVQQTLEDANPSVLVTSNRLAAELAGIQATIFSVETLSADTPELVLEELPTAQDIAYLMYTSGSTGKPKGVLVTHDNVVRLMTATDAWFHFQQDDVWTMFHSFAFDFSVWEIWGPLTTGGRLVIVPFTTSRSPEDFYKLLSDEKVTVLNQTPSAFSLLCQIEDGGTVLPLALRKVVFGGEALSFRSLRGWFERHGDQSPQLINMYGITETTVHVTYRVVREADTKGDPESLIGVPIPDLQIYLLNAKMQPVAESEIGEICVGGRGVARGYLNRAELTAERFVADPFKAGGMLYRSGDLARRRHDGELVYLGRGDNQVKINGFRIELGEVEAAISDYPGMQQVSVMAHSAEDGRQRLAAYFVFSGGTPPVARELSGFLANRLPPQMMPAFYIPLPSIPLTGNGKVDRAALPKPETGSHASLINSAATEAQAKGSPMEEQVAAIWRGVLGAAEVGFEDNFFDIGGTSVLLVSVRAQLQQKLARTIPVTWLFEFTTVRGLAGKLAEAEGAAGKTTATTPALSAAQEQARRQREAFARMKAAKGSIR